MVTYKKKLKNRIISGKMVQCNLNFHIYAKRKKKIIINNNYIYRKNKQTIY